MEWFVVVVVIVALWAFFRSREKEAERREELSSWEWGGLDHDTGVSDTWIFDFRTMIATHEVWAAGMKDSRMKYLFRKHRDVWQVKMTDETLEAVRADLREQLADPKRFGHSFAKDELEALEGGAKWEPLRDEKQGGLSSAYDRFTRQG